MTALHAFIAAGAIVVASAGVVIAVAVGAAGRTDDIDGRPRG